MTYSIAEDIHDKLQAARLDVLLLGFPKCGTTAFADWLNTSDRIHVSNPKETFELCPEFSSNRARSHTRSLSECFSPDSGQIRIEATTLNVYSPKLLSAATPLDLRAIILVRNPVEIATSWHNQMIQAGIQHDDDFVRSWEHAVSADAQQIPEGRGFLQRYDQILQHGAWVNQWCSAIGHTRLLILPFEMAVRKPGAVQTCLESFLQQTLSLNAVVPKRNAYSKPRNAAAYKLLRSPVVKNIYGTLEALIPNTAHFRRFMRDKVLLKATKKPPISDSVAALVGAACHNDQLLLNELIRQNQEVWPIR